MDSQLERNHHARSKRRVRRSEDHQRLRAPKLVSLTDDVLFGDVWRRPELAPRDRSLITVAALITGGNTEQLRAHLAIAKENASPRPSARKRSSTSRSMRAGPGRCPPWVSPSKFSTTDAASDSCRYHRARAQP
jgi:Carboxymuconolactone decarboxylase family